MEKPAKGRRELLHRLLEKYERGGMYGRSAPWPREVILRIDPKEFPAVGREELADPVSYTHLTLPTNREV